MVVTKVSLNQRRRPANALHPFEGFGAQFNANIFRPARVFPTPTAAKGESQPKALSPAQQTALAATLASLRPGHSRLFVHRELVSTPTPPAKELEAFLSTIKLAQDAGCEHLNLTFWGQGTYASKARLKALQWPNKTPVFLPPGTPKWPPALLPGGNMTGPAELMQRFANIIATARKNSTCVTHVTIHNEPNGNSDLAQLRVPGLSMRLYERLYRLLDESLHQLQIRSAVKLIGGDLVMNKAQPQDTWIQYIQANMDTPRENTPGVHDPSVVDGYSIHVYWDPRGGPDGFPAKLEKRLEDLAPALDNLGITKPLYVTEFGVKIKDLKKGQREPGGTGGGHGVEFSQDVAFQHAWFMALAPQYGAAGLVKWALYRTDVPAHWGEWGMIDAPNAHDARPPRPPFGRSHTYKLTRFFNQLVELGSIADRFGRSADRTILASKFTKTNNESIVVLNRGAHAQQVSVAGLRPNTVYFLADWNRDGHGGAPEKLASRTSNAARSLTVPVPGNGVVGLSTRDFFQP